MGGFAKKFLGAILTSMRPWLFFGSLPARESRSRRFAARAISVSAARRRREADTAGMQGACVRTVLVCGFICFRVHEHIVHLPLELRVARLERWGLLFHPLPAAGGSQGFLAEPAHALAARFVRVCHVRVRSHVAGLLLARDAASAELLAAVARVLLVTPNCNKEHMTHMIHNGMLFS